MKPIITNKNFLFLSLGLGVQSTVLYFLSQIEKTFHFADIFFADTGHEKTATYLYLDYLQNLIEKNNWQKITVLKNENTLYGMLRDIHTKKLKIFLPIPFFSISSDNKVSRSKRQCTSLWKIKLVNQGIRDFYKLKKYQAVPLHTIALGITSDEIHRVKDSREKTRINYYPFLDEKFFNPIWSRKNCIAYLKFHNLQIPEKSSCVFCPFQSHKDFLRLKEKSFYDFQKAVYVDSSIRTINYSDKKYLNYLRKDCHPLVSNLDSSEQCDLDFCDSGYCCI